MFIQSPAQIADPLFCLVVGYRRFHSHNTAHHRQIVDHENRAPLGNDRYSTVVEMQDQFEHTNLFVNARIGVYVFERALLQKPLAQQAGGLQDQALIIGQGIRPDQLDDLLQVTLALEDGSAPVRAASCQSS